MLAFALHKEMVKDLEILQFQKALLITYSTCIFPSTSL